MIDMAGAPLIEFVLTTTSLCIGLLLGACFCCLYFKITDMWLARRKQIPWQTLGQNPKPRPSDEGECCTIYIPDVGIVL